MNDSPLFRVRGPRPAAWNILGLCAVLALGTLAHAQLPTLPESVTDRMQQRAEQFVSFVDRLPEVLPFGLPDLSFTERVQVYAHPHLGDFIHRDYLRLPVGIRGKMRGVEGNAELETYFTHGLKDSAGYGLSSLVLGLKNELEVIGSPSTAWSAGLNYRTPLSRPPLELTDGMRHTMPYLGATFPLYPRWRIAGFSTLGADILHGTSTPPRFGRNQLHANSIGVTLGGVREFKRFQATTTVSYTTAALMSDESDHVTAVRPSVLIPFEAWPMKNFRTLWTLGAAAVWGPDGNDFGIKSSVRFEVDIHGLRRANAATAQRTAAAR